MSRRRLPARPLWRGGLAGAESAGGRLGRIAPILRRRRGRDPFFLNFSRPPLSPEGKRGAGGYSTVGAHDEDEEMGDKTSLLAGPTALAASVAPQWVEQGDQAAADIALIREKMGELTRLHAHALLVSFDDMDDDGGTIEVLTQDITRLFKRAELRLKKVGEGAANADAVEARVRRNVQTARAQELQVCCLCVVCVLFVCCVRWALRSMPIELLGHSAAAQGATSPSREDHQRPRSENGAA